MVLKEPLIAVVSLFVLSMILTSACSTGAVAVDECREIQYERCESALLCGFADVSSFADVDECKRFYRDQCLHGIQNTKAPTKQEHSVCLDLIDSALTCARSDVVRYLGEEGVTLLGENGWNGERPDDEFYTPAKDCDGIDTTLAPGVPITEDTDLTVCEVLNAPFYLFDCSYVSTPVSADSMGGSQGE